MSTEASAPPAASTRLSQELEDFLEALDGKDTTVGELVTLIGDRGFGLLLLVLALLVPIMPWVLRLLLLPKLRLMR